MSGTGRSPLLFGNRTMA